MTRPPPLLRAADPASESGALALMLALAMCALFSLLVAILVQVTSYNVTDSAFRLEQNQAFDAAEGGLDLAIGDVEQAGQASQMPCSAVTSAYPTTPVASSASATVTYYSSYSGAGPSGQIACVSGALPAASQVQAVIIVATGHAGRHPQATAYVEAELKLQTVYNNALFSSQSITSVNGGQIYGDPPGSNNANVYTNGSISCGNGFSVQGSVSMIGTFTGTNNCAVNGDIVAGGNVSLSNNTSVTGSVYAGGVPCGSPAATISMANNAVVDQSAYACGAITTTGSAKVLHVVAANESPLPSAGTVHNQSLPSWTNPATDPTAKSAWQAAGYSFENEGSKCSNVYTDITSATSPLVVTTSCALSWSSAVTLQTNVAVFSTAGFSMTNRTSWASNSSTTRLLYVIVPSPETCSGGQPGITLANNTSFAASVNVLFYTPCTVQISNNDAGYGQIYAGQVSASNNFSQHFVPVPSPAATGGGSLIGSLIFERQVVMPPALPS